MVTCDSDIVKMTVNSIYIYYAPYYNVQKEQYFDILSCLIFGTWTEKQKHEFLNVLLHQYHI